MPYAVEIAPRVRRLIRQWPISDTLLVEIYLRLDTLKADPRRLLRATSQVFPGMSFYFSIIDPDNRLCEHEFELQVVYGQDEERLHVVQGAHPRTTIGP
jgi:hypothetical protein